MGKCSKHIKKELVSVNRKNLLIYAIIIYVLCIMVFFFYEYSKSKEIILSNVDAKLKSGAISVNYIVPEMLYDMAGNNLYLFPNQDRNNTLSLSKYTDEAGVKYIYSLIMLDNKVYFCTSSATKNEILKGDIFSYMTEYPEATDALKELFKAPGKELIETSEDSYGYFRSYLRSYMSSKGVIYVTGADMEVKDIKKLYIKSFLKSTALAVILLIVIFPLVYFYQKIVDLETINKINRKKLEKLEIDEVTGLPYIEKLWIDNQPVKFPSIFLLGISNLKVINSHYGDGIGDRILKHISETLLRMQDTGLNGKVYKVGLDEYAVIIDDEKSREDIYITGEYILENIYDNPFVDNDENIIITLTVGASFGENQTPETAQENLINLKKVFLEARMSLNYAYERQLRIFVFDNMEINDMSSVDDEIFWTKKISKAIKDKRIQPYFQPIYNIKTGRIEKYESLMRLISPDGRVLTPYYFLSISHKIGLYFKLTESIICRSFEFFADKNIDFSVNISVKDILNESTKRMIIENIKKFPKPEFIVFEILESEGVSNFDEIISFIKSVKEMGCKIALDDFGSGYSNFERISKLEIDYIKIDGSLIKNIDTNKNNEILVQMIVDFSKKLNRKTIAEFVHSESVYNKVKELGVDYAQGYYIGEPGADLAINHKLDGLDSIDIK